MYRIVVEQQVYKDLDKIPVKDLDRIHAAISSLGTNPRKAGSHKLQGYKDRYRIRQGDYRIIYEIDEAAKSVMIFLVRHRKEVYRNL